MRRGPRGMVRIVCAVLIALVPLAAPAGAWARSAPVARQAATPPTPAPPPPPPEAWILVDVDTGNVVDAGNAHVALPPASLTKVITGLAAMSQLEDKPDVQVPVSARAAGAPAMNLNMKEGQVWTLQDTLYSMFLSSANDAALALAERAGGSVEHFQEIFATTAAALGMQDNPVLRDPAGLDDSASVDGGNTISARDLAIAGRALLHDPVLSPIVATPVYRFTGPGNIQHRLGNHNHLLTMYSGAVGMKTGYTRRAGNCLISAARRNGRTMLAVVLHAPDMYGFSSALLDKGFSTPVEAEPLADALPPVPADALALAQKLKTTPTTVPGTAGAAARGGAGESAAALLPHGRHSDPLTSGPALVVESLLVAIALLRVRRRVRQRRRHRYHPRHRTT